MKRIFMIMNPKSGRTKPKSMLFEIMSVFSEHNCMVTTVFTRVEGDAVKYALEACESRLYDAIITCGGDGTLSETMSGVQQSENRLPIGYIPCGSTNDYARSLGISTDYVEAAEKAVTGSAHKVDIGRLNDRCFNYIASFGAFTSVSYSAPRSLKNMLGHMAYVLEGTKELTKIKSNHVRMETTSSVYENDYIFGAIVNSTSIGGIVKLDEALVSFNDGVFEVCLVKKPKSPADVVKIVRGVMNSDFSAECFEFFRASNMKITAPEEMSWSLDGEKSDPGRDIEFKIIHGAVDLII